MIDYRFFQLGELLVVEDPMIVLALNLSRYKDNFVFDPIDETTTGEAIVETVEEVISVWCFWIFFVIVKWFCYVFVGLIEIDTRSYRELFWHSKILSWL